MTELTGSSSNLSKRTNVTDLTGSSSNLSIKSKDERTIDEKFDVLASVVGKLPDQEIVDTSLNLLVNGKFDLEASFIIASGDALLAFLAFIRKIDSILQDRIKSRFRF